MNNFNKYFGLMLMLFGGLIGFILLIILFFYILKLCSITLFNIPGFDHVFHYMIITIPYVIFFAAYYYMHKKIRSAQSKVARIFARLFLITGSMICLVSVILCSILFFGVKNDWLIIFDENTHYALIVHILILFLTAAITATGDPKEKDWMERVKREKDI